ncbi:MAG: gamma-glutamyltransferase [Bacteroidia bacterium]
MRYLILLIFLIGSLFAQDRLTGEMFATRSAVIAQHGMAATSQPLATQVALDILKQGGSAVDAAIAANATLGLMEPTGNGIGGDIFAIVWSAKEQKLYGLNGSGRSPESLSLDTLRAVLTREGRTKIPALGPLPVSVPGAVDGWFTLHEKFGKIPMVDILRPAINYAEKGFPMSELIAYYLERSGSYLQKYPGFRSTWMPSGKTPREGEMYMNRNLGRTLRMIAKGGRDEFYEGEIASGIVGAVRNAGGYLTLEDLAKHRSEWVEPVSVNYRGYDVWELPPNGQGIAALQMLNILEDYDLKSMGFGSAEYLHVLTEAKKLAFEDRARFYADPAFSPAPVDKLLSKNYAAERRKLIGERAARSYSPGKLEDGDTIYLTVADKDGNMVSLIQSNYRGMGSGIIPSDMGFMLQDRGELFSLKDGHPNVYAPGKRPFHTIIPAFVTKEGKPFMSFGVMGGAMQPQGHVQIIVNMIDFGMNVQEAGDAPRMRHEGSSQPTDEQMTDGGILNLESGFSPAVLRALRRRGHRLGTSVGGYGGYQAIMYDAIQGVYHGASESRKDGQAAGY